jgi:hypothetical protein
MTGLSMDRMLGGSGWKPFGGIYSLPGTAFPTSLPIVNRCFPGVSDCSENRHSAGGFLH